MGPVVVWRHRHGKYGHEERRPDEGRKGWLSHRACEGYCVDMDWEIRGGGGRVVLGTGGGRRGYGF